MARLMDFTLYNSMRASRYKILGVISSMAEHLSLLL